MYGCISRGGTLFLSGPLKVLGRYAVASNFCLLSSCSLDLCILVIDILLWPTLADGVRLIDDNEGWVAAVVHVNILEATVGCIMDLVRDFVDKFESD